MSDRRHPAMPSDHHQAAAYSSGQWSRNAQPQGYAGSNHHYAPSGYAAPHIHPDSVPRQMPYPYTVPNDQPTQVGYPSSARATHYPPHTSQPMNMYSPQPAAIQPPSYSSQHSQHNYMSSPTTGRQGYSHNHVGPALISESYDAVSPTPSGYAMQYPTSSPSPPPMSPSPQSVFIQGQYPASPLRPFACDMCALSFNRQHDLKRHRETHSGEKPFLCNGGCSKTFTRKDALKRHQVSITLFSGLQRLDADRHGF